MSHKQFGPDRFSRFDVYWIQTNKQTDRQAKFIYRYVAYSRPNGWTEWAEIFCGHSWVCVECFSLKKLILFSKVFFIFFFKFYFIFHGQRRALQLVVYQVMMYANSFTKCYRPGTIPRAYCIFDFYNEILA